MLPERLSTDLTSLGEGEDRLAFVVEMEVAADGSVHQSAIYRSLVNNHAKLAYHGVGAWLEGQRADARESHPAPREWTSSCGCRIRSRRR